MGQSRFYRHKDSSQIDSRNPIPIPERDFLTVANFVDACVIHENIDLPEVIHRLINNTLD